MVNSRSAVPDKCLLIKNEEKTMDPRLEEACHAGDVASFRRLLQEDRLLLHRFASVAQPADNPLHISVSLGHVEFTREILARKPKMAYDLNAQGLSPLHLASANGHLEVVKELLSAVGSDLCRIQDKNGLTPIHTAAINGRVDVMKELANACSESVRALTERGDSILHLAVKSNHVEAVKFLVNRFEGDDELLSTKDVWGNTILHVAVITRQLQTTKFLLSKPDVDVNAKNIRGSTPLDVLLESQSEHGDLALGEVIRAAGGTTEGKTQPTTIGSSSMNPRRNRSSWARRVFQRITFSRSTRPHHQGSKLHKKKEDNYTPDTLMLVATLIATVTFQAGMNPPGGFVQSGSSGDSMSNNIAPSSGIPEGKAVLGDDLFVFLVYDLIGLFASMTIILMLICVVPQKQKKLLSILKWVMWFAVYFTVLAFTAGLPRIYPNWVLFQLLNRGWSWVFRIFLLWMSIRLVIYLLRKVGWWKKKDGDGENTAVRGCCCLICKRILVVVVILIVLLGLAFVNYLIFVAVDEKLGWG